MNALAVPANASWNAAVPRLSADIPLQPRPLSRIPSFGPRPATVPGPVIDTLVIAYISTIVLLGLGTIWRIRKFPITRADHEERVRRLAEGEKTVEARAG